MTVRKMLTGFVAVAGVLAFTADAQAFGKRKKNKGGCDSCAAAAPVSTGCGGCGMASAGGPGGYAMLAPEAMPAVGTATTTPPTVIKPVSGTTGSTVVPATAVEVPQGNVIPAGGYFTQDGQYVQPAGYSPAVQESGANNSTRRGIFRR